MVVNDPEKGHQGLTLGITVCLAIFLLFVVIAIVIASPVAWYFMHQWLQDFVYRVPISWWIYGIARACAVAIALATVSVQAIRATMANPVQSLRATE